MQRLFKRTTPIILSGLLALVGAAACGDDDGGDNADDADDTDDGDDTDDDGGDEPDAGEPDAAPPATHSGTIAVTETTITNPDIALRGAVVSAAFIDDTTAVAPLPGFAGNIGSCAITVFEGGASATATDEGAITVTGVASNGDFACGFVAGEYRCQSTDPAAAGGSVTDALLVSDGGLGTLTVDVNTFPNIMIGMTVVLNGFPNDAVNGVPFPVVNVAGGGTVLALFGVPDTGKGGVTGDADSTYSAFVGAGPIPVAKGLPEFDFLDDGTTPVVISKAEGEFLPELDFSGATNGEGFTLAEGSAQPHEFPTAMTNDPLVFSCVGEGCGANPPAGGFLHAMIINGEANDGDITGLPPFVMPEEFDTRVTFQCAFLASGDPPIDNTATMTAAAVNAVLETNPTRVQVTVGRFTARSALLSGDGMNVALGHSLTGFTDIPPPALR